MKKSSEYNIEDIIMLDEQVFKKTVAEEIVPEGVPHNSEIWVEVNTGKEYTPTLTFSLGLSEPSFIPLASNP
jgi:hypothetical protein